MEHKKAINVLLKIKKKYSLNSEEEEAILIAIGTLDCGSLINNRIKRIIKARKAKQDKDIQ
jgi:hypothetical protein